MLFRDVRIDVATDVVLHVTSFSGLTSRGTMRRWGRAGGGAGRLLLALLLSLRCGDGAAEPGE